MPILNAKVVPFVEVASSFMLERLIYSLEGVEEGEVYFVKGDYLLQEDLDLTPDPGDNVLGIIVDGDLEIDGDLLSFDDDSFFLLITGNLDARLCWNDGAEIVVGGNFELEHGLIGDSPHGYVHIEGDLITPYMVVNSHEVEVSGDNQATTIDLDENSDNCEYDQYDLMEEVLNEDGEFDLRLIQQRLRNGEPILK